jgi:hypothetical protein
MSPTPPIPPPPITTCSQQTTYFNTSTHHLYEIQFIPWFQAVLGFGIPWCILCTWFFEIKRPYYQRFQARRKLLFYISLIGVIDLHLILPIGYVFTGLNQFPCLWFVISIAFIIPFVGGGLASRAAAFYWRSVFEQKKLEISRAHVTSIRDIIITPPSEQGVGIGRDNNSNSNEDSQYYLTLQQRIYCICIALFIPNSEQIIVQSVNRIAFLHFLESDGGIIGVVCILLVPSLIAIVITIGVNPIYTELCNGCTSESGARIFVIIQGVGLCILVLQFAYRSRRYQDPWGIRLESIAYVIAGLFGILGYILWEFVPSSPNFPFAFLMYVGSWGIIFVQTFGVYGIAWIYDGNNTSTIIDDSTHNRGKTLLEVLDDPLACHDFEEHLTNELTIEALLFYREVKRYRDLWSELNDSTRRVRAKRIAKTYISPNGVYAINIPSHISSKILNAVKDKNYRFDDLQSKSLFDEASKEVLTLLGNSYRRYVINQQNKQHKIGTVAISSTSLHNNNNSGGGEGNNEGM